MGKTAKTLAAASTPALAEARTITLGEGDFWKFDAMCTARQLAEERAATAAQLVQTARAQLATAINDQTVVLTALAQQHTFDWEGCTVAIDRATLSIIVTPPSPDSQP